MKYRLKKDLPFAKAGAEVRRETMYGTLGEEHWIVNIDKKYTGGSINQWQHIGYVKYIEEGWIEEVKPREYKLGLNEDGTFAFLLDNEGRGYDAQRKYSATEIIKLREVLE